MNNQKNTIGTEATVKQLHQQGFKVGVRHERIEKGETTINECFDNISELKFSERLEKQMGRIETWMVESNGEMILPWGGKTEVRLSSQNNRTFLGVSNCSILDGYNKKVGLKIALGRAIKQYLMFINS